MSCAIDRFDRSSRRCMASRFVTRWHRNGADRHLRVRGRDAGRGSAPDGCRTAGERLGEGARHRVRTVAGIKPSGVRRFPPVHRPTAFVPPRRPPIGNTASVSGGAVSTGRPLDLAGHEARFLARLEHVDRREFDRLSGCSPTPVRAVGRAEPDHPHIAIDRALRRLVAIQVFQDAETVAPSSDR